MFDFLKKKEPDYSNPFISFSDDEKRALEIAARYIRISLASCSNNPQEIADIVNSKFFRGYIVGLFDVALQLAGMKYNGIGELIVKLSYGFSKIFNTSETKSNEFIVDTIHLEGDEEYMEAQKKGGYEYLKFSEGKTNGLYEIEKHFYHKK